MLRLRAYLPSDRVHEVIARLAAMDGVRHAIRAGDSNDGIVLVTAEVEARSGDAVLEAFSRLGIGSSDLSLEYETAAGPVGHGRDRWLGTTEAMVWADVVESARDNARLSARYEVYMAVAGVIAGFGVINKSPILIVGAMAVSPDFYPISAACVGLVQRWWGLTGRALATLGLGMAGAGVTAWATTALMKAVGYSQLKVQLGDGGLGVLPTINASTFLIALVAGVAGMLALETRASAAVGVAISITTIPAISYAGVALFVGETQAALIAIAVLCINVVMILVSGTVTLVLQRRLRRGTHMAIPP
jgi:uncharacterized hydrophobic protein (TIGR00271 family)